MIRVSDDWVIDTDERQYIVCKDPHKTRKGKDGKEAAYYKPVGYFGTLEGALTFMIGEKVRADLSAQEYSLREAIQVIKDAKQMVEKEFNTAIGGNE